MEDGKSNNYVKENTAASDSFLYSDIYCQILPDKEV